MKKIYSILLLILFIPMVIFADELDSNKFIKNMIVKNYELNFSNDIFEYDLVINDEDRIDIICTLADYDINTYEVFGNSDLKTGSIIKVNVYNESDTLSYYINIYRKKDLIRKYILIGLSVVTFIIVLFTIIVKKKNRRKQNEKK